MCHTYCMDTLPVDNLTPKTQTPLPTHIAVGFFIVTTVSLSIYVVYLLQKINLIQQELAVTQQSLASYSVSASELSLRLKQLDAPTLSADNTCGSFTDSELITPDKKYYLYFLNGQYVVCASDISGKARLLDHYEARIQHEDTLVITTYGDLMFLANLKNKTLSYIGIADFPDKPDYYNKDGVLGFWFFGPKEEDTDKFSPQGDKLIIGASQCHDCSTVVKNYVVDLQSNKVVLLGLADNKVKWLDNNNVTWEELQIRSKTEADYAKDPTNEFPVVIESLGRKTKNVTAELQ